jgi:hypothetical protein
VRDIDLDHARAAREYERLCELLLPDRPEHRLDGGPAVRIERAAEVGDLDACKAPQHPVDHARGQRPAERILPNTTPPARDVVARLNRLDEPRDVLRGVLQVAVHGHDDVAAPTRKPRMHGWMLAEVALEPNRADSRIVAVQTLERGERPIRRAVVDEKSARTSAGQARARRSSSGRARRRSRPRCTA